MSAGRRPADPAVVPILLLVVLIWGGSYPAVKATQPFFPPVAFTTFRCALTLSLALEAVAVLGGVALAHRV